jgi:hypothetical protein
VVSVAAQNVAVGHDTAVKEPAPPGVALLKFIAGQTVSVAAAVAVPPGPVTLRVKAYGWAVLPASAGSVTVSCTTVGQLPAPQGSVFGRPGIAGVADRTQLADRPTVAVRMTVPPAIVRP